jgi:hypothetical protein
MPEMAETGSEAFPVVRFDISGAEPSGSVTKELINRSFIHWFDINKLLVITQIPTELDVHLRNI